MISTTTKFPHFFGLRCKTAIIHKYSKTTTACTVIGVCVPFQLETLLQSVQDQNLRFTLAFGVGLHHAGLLERDRKTVEKLFVNQKIQVHTYSIIYVCTYINSIAYSIRYVEHTVQTIVNPGFL